MTFRSVFYCTSINLILLCLHFTTFMLSFFDPLQESPQYLCFPFLHSLISTLP